MSSRDIYLGEYEGWYCVSDESYVSEQNCVDGYNSDGQLSKVSAESGHTCVWVKEQNYKFRLGKYQERLLKWL